MPVPNTFDEIRAHPMWPSVSEEERTDLRINWVRDRFAASESRDQKVFQALMNEAFVDIKKPEDPNAFFPPSSAYGPRALKMVERVGRVFATPQQFLSAAASQDPSKPWHERVGSTFKETGKNLLKDVIGEERELAYPYHIYTDPLVVADAPGLIRRVAGYAFSKSPIAQKGAKAVLERVAKTGETKGGGPLPKAEMEYSLPPLKTVGKPKPMTPTFGEVWKEGDIPLKRVAKQVDLQKAYNAAMPQLTRYFPKEEAQQVAEFLARNPNDIITHFIKQGGDLSKEFRTGVTWADWIGERLFGRMIPRGSNVLEKAAPFKPKSTIKGPAGTPPPKVKPQTAPPLQPSETLSAPEMLNQAPVGPKEQAEFLKAYLTPPKP